MKLITFQLRFHTTPGQSLFIVGDHALFGEGRARVPLQYATPELWQATLVVPDGTDSGHPVSYRYLLRQPDGGVCEDWGKDRQLDLAGLSSKDVCIIDSWNNPGYFNNAFYTNPFQQVLLRADRGEFRAEGTSTPSHHFRVRAPLLTKTQTLCLLGAPPELGQWAPERAVLLTRQEADPFLSVELDLSTATFPLHYKYGVYDLERKVLVRWEDGENRVLHDTRHPERYTLIDDGFAHLPDNTWKGAGVAVPVFSLRTDQSFGVGEFPDLKPLADWCALTGLKLIQILPVNDTTATHTWKDSYPYAAISAFALHPIYLNLGQVAEGKQSKQILAEAEQDRQRLNALANLDYAEVMQAKLKILRRLFALQGEKTIKSKAYRAFFAQNRDWLIPYAAFSYLRDRFKRPDFSHWPEFHIYRAEEIQKLAAEAGEAQDEIHFVYFVQFHLHEQLSDAAAYAHERGVIVKGDIAIGAGRFGADTWQSPELFHMDVQAGAPPDAFGIKGQNWSFPTYNWQRMQQDGFAWWKSRFAQMSRYFDAFRIDHILGFFRIWSVPLDAVEGILGYFVPALPVRESEFTSLGIHFDRERFTRPFITSAIVRQMFGIEAERVTREFLASIGPDRFGMRPEFATQRKIERHFATIPEDARTRALREGLFDLLTNVLMFEGTGPEEFHFRFNMEATSSFAALAPATQTKLKQLYVDYFFRRQDGFWMAQALEKLPVLKRVTNMLVCGEDLGLVPACVPDVMQQLGLLSLDVQRMPKRSGLEFFDPATAPYLDVVTPGTHDMSTIRGWWKEDRKVTQRFWEIVLHQKGAAPEQCPASIVEAVICQQLGSPAMWSIFQIQDLLGADEKLRHPDPSEERINIPAVPNHYWRYRMHLPLEQLQKADAFNARLHSWITHARR